MKVSIIIIHWRTVELLKQQLTLLKNVDGEVIVINNDPELPLLPKVIGPSKAKIVNNPINHGFAFGCNQGAAIAKYDWLLFLNPDTHIDSQNVEKLVTAAVYEKLDATSPEVDHLDYQKPIPSFLSLLTEFSPLSRLVPQQLFGQSTLVGGCLLIKKSVLQELGGWDERFFLWFEDSDISKKLQLLEKRFSVVQGVQVSHAGGSSFKALSEGYKRDIFFSSLRLFAKKYFAPLEQLVLTTVTARFSSALLLPADSGVRASIVVPNQRKELLEEFLSANIDAFDLKKDELIIVSSCPSLLSFKTTYPDVTFIQLISNLGFASTVNLGFQRARGQYIGTVNDDTILPKDWVGKLSAHFEKNVGSVSPLILKPSKEIESQGVDVLDMGRAVPLLKQKNVVGSMAFNGACVLLNRTILQKVGLFDERFGSYLEDIDLGLRISSEGWKNIAVDDVSIVHLGQQTSRSMPVYKKWLDVRNWWFVMLKNYPARHLIQNIVPIVVERGRNFSGLLKAL